jgi:hypothetical protein
MKRTIIASEVDQKTPKIGEELIEEIIAVKGAAARPRKMKR